MLQTHAGMLAGTRVWLLRRRMGSPLQRYREASRQHFLLAQSRLFGGLWVLARPVWRCALRAPQRT